MPVSYEYFKGLSVEELLQDDYFVRSLLAPDAASDAFWEGFLVLHPERKEVFEAASAFIQTTKFRKATAAPGARERVWDHIRDVGNRQAPVITMSTKRNLKWAVAAALIIVFVSSATWMYVKSGARMVIETQVGELRQVTLPDQSVVTLNANSTLRYEKEFSDGDTRQVWLEGEAFFDVKHDGKRFIVHSGKTDVEVLGTTFNVSDRKDVTKIVLQSGSVKVNFNDRKTPDIVLKPGEMVRYNQDSRNVMKERTETKRYTAWKSKEVYLDNTSLEELIETIENEFGYSVALDNKTLLSKKLTGTGAVSMEDEKTFFRLLEVMLNVEITLAGKTLHIRNMQR